MSYFKNSLAIIGVVFALLLVASPVQAATLADLHSALQRLHTLISSVGTESQLGAVGAAGTTGLQIYLSGDETTGNDSGKSFQPAWQAGTGDYTAGVVNEAFRFDGGNEYLQFAHLDEIVGLDNFTLMAWMRRDVSRSDYESVIDRHATYNISFRDGQVRFYAFNESGERATVEAAVDDDQWHHYAMTYDEGTLTAYIDGVAVGSDTAAGGGPLMVGHRGSSWGFAVGRGAVGGDVFTGAIDEVYVYDRTLSPNEVGTYVAAVDAGSTNVETPHTPDPVQVEDEPEPTPDPTPDDEQPVDSDQGTSDTYYFDADRGNDADDCSEARPCQTLTKAISVAESVRTSSDDTTLLFASGDYGALHWDLPGDFNGQVTWTSENANSPATFSYIYLRCAGCVANQVFDGLEIYAVPDDVTLSNVQMYGVSYVTVKNSEIHNDHLYQSTAFYILNNGDANAHHIAIQDNKIHNVRRGIGFRGHNFTVTGNEMYRIPGTLIGMSAGQAPGYPHSAHDVLIEGNILRDSVGDYPDEPGYEDYDEPHELHASVFAVRGPNTTIRNNRVWGVDREKVFLQFYRSSYPGYAVADVVVEDNVFYGSDNRVFLQTYTDVVQGPITIRNNTLVGLNLYLNLSGDTYDGDGVEMYNNLVIAKIGNPYNAVGENYSAATARWEMDHNVGVDTMWFAGEFDSTNVIIEEAIESGQLPADIVDEGIFVDPDYSLMSNKDCGPDGNDSCDWTPQPDSFVCTAGRDGSYVGAIPCDGSVQTQASVQNVSPVMTTAVPTTPVVPNNQTETNVIRTTDTLNVRTAPAGEVITTIPANSRGLKTDGSTRLDGYDWIEVSFDNGVAGFVADVFVTSEYVVSTETNIETINLIMMLLQRIQVLQAQLNDSNS